MKKYFTSIGITIILVLVAQLLVAQTNKNNLWTKKSTFLKSSTQLLNRKTHPTQFDLYELNFQELKNKLEQAPLRGVTSKNELIIEFPIINGKSELFKVEETLIMEPALAAKFPAIKTYVGTGINDKSATIRFSITPKGLHTMTLSAISTTTYIEPYTQDLSTYIVYDRNAIAGQKTPFVCTTKNELQLPSIKGMVAGYAHADANDQTLRTFRLAQSCVAEYGNIFTNGNGTDIQNKADIMAQMVITMNRVNGVYERDLAVNMIFVANNDLIMYYGDVNADPWSGEYNTMTQQTIDAAIGDANYDIGHNFNTSGGGNAGCIGCVCVTGSKGSGMTGNANPVGDPFDIDFVAHEMGHQFGGNHTFTHNSEGTGVQFEPGSGSTIMGYAGITGASDVQAHSDAYFIFVNIEQITSYVQSTFCQTNTPITNNPPVANAGLDYSIPKSTAFVLNGSATDPDIGDVLTYCWEEGDEGFNAATAVSGSNTGSPNFRSFNPTTVTERYFPKLATVVGGNLSTQWETVSDVARTMNFALTIRDNVAGGGQNSIDQMQVTVDANSGPFVITSQTTPETWFAGATATITWDVAGTNTGAVNSPNVAIYLSTDNGLSFPISLATLVPNSGNAVVTVPNNTTTTGKIMVKGADNVFYAVNTGTIEIQTSEFVMDFSNFLTDTICEPTDANYTFTYHTFLGFSDTTIFSATNLPVGAIATFTPDTAVLNGTIIQLKISGINSTSIGTTTFTVIGTSPTITKSTTIGLSVFSASFGAINLNSPLNNALGITAPFILNWGVEPNALSYNIDIATDAVFTNIVESVSNVITNNYSATLLNPNTKYYWRVRAVNNCGSSVYSSTFNFITANCLLITSTNVPLVISTNAKDTITSIISVTATGTIASITIPTLNISHTWVGDLSATLTSPKGTVIQLLNQPGEPNSQFGCDGDDLNLMFDDNATNTAIDLENTCGASSPAINGSFQPIDALSSLVNESIAGDWTLTVIDHFAQDGGSLNTWNLDICLNIDPCANPFTPALALSSTETPALCATSSNGNATIVATGGTTPYTYLWSDNQTVSTAINLASGNYNLVITDSNGCQDSTVVTVTAPSAISVTSTITQAACGASDGAITLDATGGVSPYSFSWGNSETVATLTGLAGGALVVTVSDANSCILQSNQIITNVGGPSVSVTTINVTCNGLSDGNANATINGGLTPYTYLWLGDNSQSASAITALTAGTYNLLATDFADCISSGIAVITEPTALTGNITKTDVNCFNTCDGSVVVAATGGTTPYSFIWNQTANLQTTVMVTGLCTGTPIVTITDSNGCLKINQVTINEPILNNSSNTLTICNGMSYQVGNSIYSSTGFYTDTLASVVSGCDSLVNTNLTVQAAISNSQMMSLCSGNFITVGSNIYNTTGTYTDILTAASGCDSTVTTNLTIYAPVDTSVTVLGNTITSNAINSNYQWTDCNSGNQISGANGGTYTVTANGSYAVFVTDSNNCSASTNCVDLLLSVGVNELSNSIGLNMYPNPTLGKVLITLDRTEKSNLPFVVYDALGKTIVSKTIKNNAAQINLSPFAKGIYYLKINLKDQIIVRKIVRE